MSNSTLESPISMSPTVPTSFLLDDTNTAVPLLNQMLVSGGIGVETSLGAANEIIITVVNDGFAWDEKNISFSAEIGTGYFCNAELTATLPITAGLVIGNTVIIYVDTNSTVTIQASAGQFIQVGSAISLAAGIATSNAKGAILELIFKPSDLTWHTKSSLGVWSVT